MRDAEPRSPPVTPCYSGPVCAINGNSDVCHPSLPRPPSSPPSPLQHHLRDTSTDVGGGSDGAGFAIAATYGLSNVCMFYRVCVCVFIQGVHLSGLNGIKIAPVAVK